MSKNVLVISTSPRRNGNSKLLADAFANGTRQAGNSVENISLHDKTICFLQGLPFLPKITTVRDS